MIKPGSLWMSKGTRKTHFGEVLLFVGQSRYDARYGITIYECMSPDGRILDCFLENNEKYFVRFECVSPTRKP